MHTHTTCKWEEICPLLLTSVWTQQGTTHSEHTEQWAAMDGARGADVGVRCLAQGPFDSGVGRVLLDLNSSRSDPYPDMSVHGLKQETFQSDVCYFLPLVHRRSFFIFLR